MSTENEGTAVPPAPSAPPPAPVDAPAASAHQGYAAPGAVPAPPAGAPAADTAAHGTAPQPPTAGTAAYGPRDSDPNQDPASPGATPAGPPAGAHASSAPDASWPPPPPPSTPSFGDGGAGHGGWGSSYQQPAPRNGGGGRGRMIAAVLVAALVAGGAGGGLGYTLAKENDSSDSTTVSSSTSGGNVKREPGTVAAVAAKALPSTVTIEAEGRSGEGGTGTGFVFDKQGHIVTNNHVVAEAVDGGKVTATFPNGKKYDAEVVGHAQGYDVAVIKLNDAPSNLNPLALGNSDEVAVGDSTIAIGAPFGLSNTVTTGIISAKNRPVASSDGNGSQASYMSALQTDASINPGNSGGPLLDAQGNVIGINSAIQSTSNGGFGTGQAGSIGLGFAIPINQAKYVAQELIRTGKPVYAKIGASVSLEETTGGAKITEQGAGGSEPVDPGGPADKAGLQPGDVITKLDDRVIDSGPTLIGEIWTHKPGDEVTITYERDGKERITELTLGSRVGDN
ncbi:S1C family serine protease [Streptomyces sp. WAC 01420]|uniref:S1C family serine protease n=1 Tax=Streptomyces sp. WAC 01420 TaxID=2203203 RepID=UPI000F85DE43|nr:trypsin-like peptidase domain-containing protein [Streptomyces sp. WAC 01420]RSM97476.1 protease [Streptomyces sp. WAC 01420]